MRAINRGVADVVADVDAGIDAVARRNPAIDRAANRARLVGTLALEMAHPEGSRIGIGAVDPLRIATTVELMSRAKALQRPPERRRGYSTPLPAAVANRVRTLARECTS